jgi:hypothetical protein
MRFVTDELNAALQGMGYGGLSLLYYAVLTDDYGGTFGGHELNARALEPNGRFKAVLIGISRMMQVAKGRIGPPVVQNLVEPSFTRTSLRSCT